jgi:hypothetical protein
VVGGGRARLHELLRTHLRGVHADLDHRQARGDGEVGVREPLGEAGPALVEHGPSVQGAPDLAGPDPLPQVAGDGGDAAVGPDRIRAGAQRVQQAGGGELGGRAVSHLAGQPRLRLSGDRGLGHHQHPGGHASTFQKSRAVRAVPRTDPETLERVPAARGW